MSSSSLQTPQVYAICIGIDFYYNDYNNQKNFLHGCVSDAKSFALYLGNRTKNRVPRENITLLTSTIPEHWHMHYKPSELELEDGLERIPNRNNITKALLGVAERAQPGDQVIITYSGHGSREWTIVPNFQTKGGESGFDETLMTLDAIRSPENGGCEWRGIRDFELSYLFTNIIKKEGVHLTVILDCCHSGGATRGSRDEVEAVVPRFHVRTLPDYDDLDETEKQKLKRASNRYPDVRPLGHNHKPGMPGISLHELQEHWDQMKERTEHIPDSHSVVKPLGYELFTACLQHELSWEVNGGGLFTSEILDTLATVEDERAEEISLAMVFRNVFDRVYRVNKWEQEHILQTPVFWGDSRRGLLNTGRGAKLYEGKHEQTRERVSIPIHANGFPKGTPSKEGLLPLLELRAGSAHGVKIGDEYGVYLWTEEVSHASPPDAPDRVRVEVTNVGQIASSVKVVATKYSNLERFQKLSTMQLNLHQTRREEFIRENPGVKKLEPVYNTVPWPSGCHAVLVAGSSTKRVSLIGEGSLAAPWNEERHIRGRVGLTVFPEDGNKGRTKDFTVTRVSTGHWEVRDANCKEGKVLSATSDIDTALKHITHICIYRARSMVQTPAELKKKELKLGYAYFDFKCQTTSTLEKLPHGSIVDTMECSFKCRAEYMAEQALPYVNFAVFHFSANFGIRQVYPLEGPFESVDPGSITPKIFSFQKQRPNPDAPGPATEKIVLVAFVSSTSFRIWEMDEIDANVNDEQEEDWSSKFRNLGPKDPDINRFAAHEWIASSRPDEGFEKHLYTGYWILEAEGAQSI